MQPLLCIILIKTKIMGQLTEDEVLKYVQLVFRSCSNAIKKRKLLKQMESRMGK